MSILVFIAYWLAASVLFVSGYVYRVAMERAQSWTDRTVRRRVLSLEGSRPCKRAIRP